MAHATRDLYTDLAGRTTSELTRATVAPVVRDPARFAALFYQRLFEHSPGLRRLFPADLAEQGLKLAQTVYLLVSAQDHAEALAPTLRELGRRHQGYGVLPQHYRVAGEVLLDTLAELNGEGWSEPARVAWAELYGEVARVMQSG